MGLDIYLYRYENFAETQRKEAEYKNRCNALLRELCADQGRTYEHLTETEKEQARQATNKIAQELGLNEYGSDVETKKKIELPSTRHPDHLFKVGYFRSSYNENGINRVMENATGYRLESIFPNDGEYAFQPNWIRALEWVRKVRQTWTSQISEHGAFQVEKHGYNVFTGLPSSHPIQSETDALKAFVETAQQHKNSSVMHWFSNREGTYYLGEKPLKVRGIITGVEKSLFGNEYTPCNYVITEDEEKFNWYIDALDVVEETIEFVLSQTVDEQKKFYLHWSG